MLVLSGSWAFFLGGTYLTLDMSLSALLGMALCCCLLARHAALLPGSGSHAERYWMCAAGLAHWDKFITMTHGASASLAYVVASMAMLASGGLGALWLIHRKSPDRAIVMLAFASLLAWSGIFIFMHEQDGHFSAQRLNTVINPSGQAYFPHTPFYSL